MLIVTTLPAADVKRNLAAVAMLSPVVVVRLPAVAVVLDC